MNEIQKYIAAHEPKMMDDLFSLIRIPQHQCSARAPRRYAGLCGTLGTTVIGSRCGRSIGNALKGQSGCFRSKDRRTRMQRLY